MIDKDALQPTYKRLDELLGSDLLLQFYEEFRGSQLNLPMKLYDREGATRAILKNYPTMTIKELSDQYGYSQRWVKQTLKQHEPKNT